MTSNGTTSLDMTGNHFSVFRVDPSTVGGTTGLFALQMTTTQGTILQQMFEPDGLRGLCAIFLEVTKNEFPDLLSDDPPPRLTIATQLPNRTTRRHGR